MCTDSDTPHAITRSHSICRPHAQGPTSLPNALREKSLQYIRTQKRVNRERKPSEHKQQEDDDTKHAQAGDEEGTLLWSGTPSYCIRLDLYSIWHLRILLNM